MVSFPAGKNTFKGIKETADTKEEQERVREQFLRIK
jgi:hypothetical protein